MSEKLNWLSVQGLLGAPAAQIGATPIVVPLTPAMKALFDAHAAAVPGEAAAFARYRSLDAVIASTTHVSRQRVGAAAPLPGEAAAKEACFNLRVAILTPIKSALRASWDRQHGLLKACKDRRSEVPTVADAKEFRRAVSTAAKARDHIPEDWRTDDPPALVERIETLCLADPERDAVKDRHLGTAEATKNAEKLLLEGLIAKGSLRSVDRTRFFFDPVVEGLSAEEEKELRRAHAIILARAIAIRDAGGTVEEAERSLAHLPPEFWPPEFVRKIQAWRKVERELAAERAAARTRAAQEEAAKSADFSWSDGKDVFDFVMNTVGFVALSSDLGRLDVAVGSTAAGAANIPCVWRGASGTVEAFGGFTTALQNGFGLGAEVYEAFKGFDGTREALEAVPALRDFPARLEAEQQALVVQLEAIATRERRALADQQRTHVPPGSAADTGATGARMVSAGVGIVNNLGWGFSALSVGDAAAFASNVIPGLCAAQAGIDLMVTMRSLKKALNMKARTNALIQAAETEDATGTSYDDGALVRALLNEKRARELERNRLVVDVTAKTAVATGEVVLATGVGAAAGLGLKVTGKSIEYGNKIVFANIDFNTAERAKSLLERARAGDPDARAEIFEHSALYAKMYIAILAKDTENPKARDLARTFIVDRGITEEDLDNPAVAMSVLREKLLKHSSQQDEREVSDSRAVAVATAVAGKGTVKGASRAGNALASVVEGVAKRYRRSEDGDAVGETTLEDHFWTPPPFHSDINKWAKAWSAVKADAVTNGGYWEQRTGVKEAFEVCASAVTAANLALNTYKAQRTESNKVSVLKKFKAAEDALARARGTALAVVPKDTEGKLHTGIKAYLAQAGKAVVKEYKKIALMRSSSDLPRWKAPTFEDDVTKWATQWSAAKHDAVAKGVDVAEETGLKSALQKCSAAVRKAEVELTRYEASPVDRGALLDASRVAQAALDDAVALVMAAKSESADGELRGYLDEAARVVGDRRATIEHALTSHQLRNRAWVAGQVASLEGRSWHAVWASAVDGCGVPSDDGGVEKALVAAAAEAASAARATDPSVRFRQREASNNQYGLALKAVELRIAGAAIDYAGLHGYLNEVLTLLQGKRSAYESEQTDWQPPSVGSGLDSDKWRANWDDAVARFGVESEDGGVQAGLADAARAEQEGTKARVLFAKRGFRKAQYGKYVVVLNALNELRSGRGGAPALNRYLTEMCRAVIDAARAVDTEFEGAEWVAPAHDLANPALWLSAFGDAVDRAVKSGLLEDVAAGKASKKAIENFNAAGGRLKESAGLELRAALTQFSKASSRATEAFRGYLARFVKAVGVELERLRSARRGIDFSGADLVSLDGASWRGFYEAARNVDAVPKSEKASILEKALVAFQQAKVAKKSDKMLKALGVVGQAVSELRRKGFDENDKMARCLEWLDETAGAERRALVAPPVVDEALSKPASREPVILG
jgi:hypothetical protein